MVYIYSLKDPRDGAVKYVGQTRHLGARLAGHLSSAFGNPRKGRSQKDEWLRELESLGTPATVEILEQCDDDDKAGDAEKKWIQFHRGNGQLLNLHSGSAVRSRKSGWVSTHIQMTEAERTSCNAKAMALGMSYSDWARMTLVNAL
jgi:hypothetical protein